MDFSLESYKRLFAVRIFINQLETHYTRSQLVILQHYVTYLQKMSEIELPKILIGEAIRWMSTRGLAAPTKISEYHLQELKKYVFTVPRLKKLPEGQHGVNKYRDVKEFISFLVRLLYHKPGSITDSCSDQIKNLEKELRFLLTVLGDTLFMVCTDELQNLLVEFEDVANESGSFVHSLFFIGTYRAFGEMVDGIAVVVNHINLLKANIFKLSRVVPCMSTSAYISHSTSVVESLLVLDSFVRDLEEIMNGDRIDDVKHQIITLHQGLIRFQSFIKDTTGSPKDQLKECYMQIGDLGHQAQHLIVSFLAGDAPPWYLVNRLINVNHKIQLCRIELPEITRKHSSGGLKGAKYFDKQLSMSLPKRNNVLDEDINIVSQTYLKRNVLASILINIASELGKDEILKMEEEGLTEHIHKTLKGRRYLIVMDDIWDSNVCDELLRCFPDDENESRILFTTRNKDVIPPNCLTYALPFLSDGQCWELIQKKVFNNLPCPPELVENGQEIAASCRGMPLAAVVIAGVLSTVDKEERAWEEVRRNLSSYILDGGDNSVMQILKLSYDHLPQHLKLCFLYLGVFLEDPSSTYDEYVYRRRVHSQR